MSLDQQSIVSREGGTGLTPQPSRSASIVPKRFKACVGCRELKLRCKRFDENPNISCERCVGTGRECIVPATVRRKRKAGKGTVEIVAALEEKIDALVKMADRKLEPGNLNGANIRNYTGQLGENEAFSSTIGLSDMNQTRLSASQPMESVDIRHTLRDEWAAEENPNLFTFFIPKAPRNFFQTDVVSRGLVTLEDAERVFQKFTKFMLPHFPIVVLPKDTTVEELRQSKPALFLAILGVASSILGDRVQKVLWREMMQNYADRILLRGEDSLDLLQAVQVASLWHYAPDHYEEVKFYQLIHIGAVMAMDLGFGQENQPSISRLPSSSTARSIGPPPENTLSKEALIESQRAWLGCYFLCNIVSMTIRRPSMLRWSPHMAKCIVSLERHGISSDNLLCQWVRGQHIAEEIGEHFFMDDPSAKLDALDTQVQYLLRGFEQQLDQWQKEMPVEVRNPTIESSVHTINLYLHEIFLHVGHNINDFRPPFLQEALLPSERPKTLAPLQLKSLAVCIASVKNIIDIFLGLDTETISSLPNFNFVRPAYATVALIKIHLMASQPDGILLNIVDIDELQTELYLRRLFETTKAVMQTGKLKLASIFNIILYMLQLWFQRQCRGSNEDGPDGDHRGGINQSREGHDTSNRTSEAFINAVSEKSVLSGVGTEAEVAGVDFTTLFDADNGRLFETALGWMGGF